MSSALLKSSACRPRKKTPWKFTRTIRERFLGELVACGKVPLAARAVGVDALTVKNYVAKYEGGKDFAVRMEMAIEMYQAKAVDSLESQALNGIMEPILDKNGHQIMVHIHEGVNPDGTPRFVQVPGWRRKYETALRVAVFNRYNALPKDPAELANGGKLAGVLAVPIPAGSVGAWAELVASIRKPVAIDTTGEESK